MTAHAALVEAKAYLDGVVSMLVENDGKVTMSAFSLLQILNPAQQSVNSAIEILERESDTSRAPSGDRS